MQLDAYDTRYIDKFALLNRSRTSRKICNQSKRFPDLIEAAAKEFYAPPQCEDTDQFTDEIDIQNEVLPLMIVTDFYGGKTGHFTPTAQSSSLGKVRKKSSGTAVAMSEFFDAGDDCIPNHVTVVGPAGSGKSTILRRFVRNGLKSKKRQHIFIIDGQNYSKSTFQKAKQGESGQTSDVQKMTKRSEKVLPRSDGKTQKHAEEITLFEFLFPGCKPNSEVLIDGLDSMIKDPTSIIFIIDSIDSLPFSLEGKHPKVTDKDKATPATFMYNMMIGNLFPGCRILSSSREFAIVGYQGKLRADRIICLEGFKDDSIKKFVNFVLPKDESEVFISALESKYPEVWSLCSTPMHLSFTLLIYQCERKIESLPSTMSGVIVKILQLFSRSDHFKTSSHGQNVAQIMEQLKLLSFKGIQERKVTFEQSDLDKVHLTPKAAASLAACAPKGHGYQQNLSEKPLKGKTKFYFSHQSLQEMLCALYAIQMPLTDFETFLSELQKPELSVVQRFVSGVLLEERVFEEAIKENVLKDATSLDEKRKAMTDCLTNRLRSRMCPLEQLDFFMSLHEAGEGGSPVLQLGLRCADFSGHALSGFDMHVIGSLINRSKRLSLVALARCDVKSTSIKTLNDSAGKADTSKVLKLDMSNNCDLKDGLQSLGSLIKKWKVDELCLDGCGVSASDLKEFTSSLFGHKLKCISLAEYQIIREVTKELVEAICSLLPRVSGSINLHGWTFGAEEESVLKEELQRIEDSENNSGIRIMHGEDGEKTIEAERFEDAIERISMKFDRIEEFRKFARIKEGLELPCKEVNDAKANNPNNVQGERIARLEAWKRKHGSKASVSDLNRRVHEFLNKTQRNVEGCGEG